MSNSPNRPTRQAEARGQELGERLAAAEARITELETRTAFQDDLLNALNDVIAKQDRLLTSLSRRLELLQEQLQQHDGGGGSSGANADHELPPHY